MEKFPKRMFFSNSKWATRVPCPIHRYPPKGIVFFFSGKVCHPLTHSFSKKQWEKKNNGEKIKNNCFFFWFGKVYTPLTHSISDAGKKKQAGKKKTGFLLTHSIFAQKWSKSNFSWEKKIRYLCLFQPKNFSKRISA